MYFFIFSISSSAMKGLQKVERCRRICNAFLGESSGKKQDVNRIAFDDLKMMLSAC